MALSGYTSQKPEVAVYDAITTRDMILAMELSGALAKEYPGHRFYVHVDSHPSVGVVIIQHWMLSEDEGYVLKLPDMEPANIRKHAIMAAGEILERFKVKRGKANMDQLRDLEKVSRFNSGL